jgi:hypothetical protein
MKCITALAALSLVLGCLGPVQAQEKVVLDDLGISFKTIPGYSIVPPERRSGLDFELRGEWSRSKLGIQSGNSTLTVHVVDGMAIIALPPDRTGLYKPGELPEGGAKTISQILEKLISGFVIQKTAKIKLAGHDALASLFSMDVPEANDEVTGRLLFVATKSKLLLILFGTVNDQWDLRSKDFDKMMSTLKFLDDEPLAPEKPAPKKPTPAKSKRKSPA